MTPLIEMLDILAFDPQVNAMRALYHLSFLRMIDSEIGCIEILLNWKRFHLGEVQQRLALIGSKLTAFLALDDDIRALHAAWIVEQIAFNGILKVFAVNIDNILLIQVQVKRLKRF